MKTLVKARKDVYFETTAAVLEKLRVRRPDLIEGVRHQPLRIVIAKNLVRYRGESGMSREQLSEKAGKVGARTIQRIEEAGEDSNPTVRVLEALAMALGKDATELTDPDATIMGIANKPRISRGEKRP